MKLKIKISELMDPSKSPLSFLEDRLVRAPKDLREKLCSKGRTHSNIESELGAVLTLDGKKGPLYLQIHQAYTADVAAESDCLYVSQNTWNLLKIDCMIKLSPAEEILIGCDPEMFIIDRANSTLFSAGRFFSFYGEIGNDNGLLEIRPRPSFDPEEVTKRIGDLISTASSMIKNRINFKNRDLCLRAASSINETPAGFHIHFGLPPYILKRDAERLWVLTAIATILDYYVGIPAILPEGDTDVTRRSKKFTPYGKPGNFRGDNLTFEYRVPGGHLLKHPTYTKGILTISKMVMLDVLTRLESMSGKDKKKMLVSSYDETRKLIYPNLAERADVCDAITSMKISKALKLIESIAKDYAKMINFKKYKKIIEEYLSLALSTIGTEGISDNLEENWGVGNESKPRQMAVLQ